MKKKYDWLLFDADETLFDFREASKGAFSKTMTLHGLEEETDHYPTYKAINNAVWKELEDGKITQVELRARRFQLFLDKVGLQEDPSSFSRNYLAQLIEHTEPLPGALSLLDRLKDQFQLAIITNGMKEVQRPRLLRTGLSPFFKTIVVSDEIGHSKPQAPFFDYTFEQIGQPTRDRVLVIGDNINSDIRGGENYGLDTCWFNPRKLENKSEVKTTYEIERLEEIDQLLFE